MIKYVNLDFIEAFLHGFVAVQLLKLAFAIFGG